MDVKVALIQKPPVLLDLKASIECAVGLLKQAAAESAELVVFPEAYLCGYPAWIWRLRPDQDMALGNKIHAALRLNAVNIAAGDLIPICKVAAKHGMVVVMGMNEIDIEFSGTTLFNTVVVIGSDGAILNKHRKLMPTNPERMVWGFGDGAGLRVVETPVGRIGSLICWENYMPLARHTLYAQNVEIYVVPTWDHGETWLASMNHIAREGGCWVLSVAMALKGSDVPDDFPGRDLLFPEADEWICPGDAVVIKPFGGIAAGPLHKKSSILFPTINTEAARRSRKTLDIAGHYGRPDIFHLEVDRQKRKPIRFVEDEMGSGVEE